MTRFSLVTASRGPGALEEDGREARRRGGGGRGCARGRFGVAVMKLLVHDYSGHPFQVELSRELARRGHEVTHSSSEAYVSGKGHLVAKPGESLTFESVGRGVVLQKAFARRLVQELVAGF